MGKGDWHELITSQPRVLSGRPVIRGTHVPVSVLAGALGCGMSVAEISDAYHVTPADVEAARAYAAQSQSPGLVIVLPAGGRAHRRSARPHRH